MRLEITPARVMCLFFGTLAATVIGTGIGAILTADEAPTVVKIIFPCLLLAIGGMVGLLISVYWND